MNRELLPVFETQVFYLYKANRLTLSISLIIQTKNTEEPLSERHFTSKQEKHKNQIKALHKSIYAGVFKIVACISTSCMHWPFEEETTIESLINNDRSYSSTGNKTACKVNYHDKIKCIV